jgi:septal ring factor EnvC (AmiA/AmiB activator)
MLGLNACNYQCIILFGIFTKGRYRRWTPFKQQTFDEFKAEFYEKAKKKASSLPIQPKSTPESKSNDADRIESLQKEIRKLNSISNTLESENINLKLTLEQKNKEIKDLESSKNSVNQEEVARLTGCEKDCLPRTRN